MELWVGCSLLVYLIIMIALGRYAQSRVNTEEDYLVAGRRLPLWLAWGTLLATWFGAATVLGASDAARDEGMRGTILDPFASGVSLIVAGVFFAKPLWNRKLLTTGDLFAQAYGPKTEFISSLVQAAGYVPWIAAQYIALGTLLNHYFPISASTGIFVAAAFVLFLTMSGGMWSVTLTDTLQIILVLISLIVLFAVLMSQFGDGSVADGFRHAWEVTPREHRTLLPEAGVIAMAFWVGTWMNGVLGNLPGQDLMQRVFASNSARTAQQACVLAGVIYLFFGLLPVWIGLGSRILLPDHDGGGILFALSDALLSTPMTCLFVVSLISILVSTCTSALLSPSALLAHNLLGRLNWWKSSKLAIDRWSVVAVTAVSLPFAFFGQEILDLLDVAFEIALVGLFVPFTMGLFGRPKGELTGLLSVGLGTGIWLIHRGYPWPPDSLPTMIPTELTGTFSSLVGYVLGQRLAKNQSFSST
ncbi:sodium:solute symporter family protein [Thalassoglobus sp. JC818]|uniref:sodium:solute symporter family protein n=1 Tax=Thalassoglobus sp. JC818 TaxID=3232136 RepID=UPI0034598ACD